MLKTQFIVGVVSAAVLMIVGGSPSAAFAQTNSLFGSRGPTGNSSNSFSSSFSLGGGSGATGGRITSGFSSSGMNFLGGGPGGRLLGIARDSNRVGMNNAGSNANSNRRNSGTRNSRNSRGARNSGRNGGRQSFGDNFRDFNRGGRQGRNTKVRNVRPRQRVNFAFPLRTTAIAVDSLQAQFTNHAENRPALAGVSVLEDDGRVILIGVVDSEENRRLAVLIAKLEPGVTVVENRLTIR